MSGLVIGKRGRHHESYVSHMREVTLQQTVSQNCFPESQAKFNTISSSEKCSFKPKTALVCE